MKLPYKGHLPEIGENIFIAPGAYLIGRVILGDDCSVFFNSVLRGDINSIAIGGRTNIQDNCTIHVSSAEGVAVGRDVTVGHNVVLHACRIGDNVTIGMSSTIMNGAVVGENSIVAAGSLIPQGKVYPAGVLLLGSPAKVIRDLTGEEVDANRKMAEKYIGVKNYYLQSSRIDISFERRTPRLA